MINENNWLTITMHYLDMLQEHLEIAGTEQERLELENLINYLNKTN